MVLVFRQNQSIKVFFTFNLQKSHRDVRHIIHAHQNKTKEHNMLPRELLENFNQCYSIGKCFIYQPTKKLIHSSHIIKGMKIYKLQSAKRTPYWSGYQNWILQTHGICSINSRRWRYWCSIFLNKDKMSLKPTIMCITLLRIISQFLGQSTIFGSTA